MGFVKIITARDIKLTLDIILLVKFIHDITKWDLSPSTHVLEIAKNLEGD